MWCVDTGVNSVHSDTYEYSRTFKHNLHFCQFVLSRAVWTLYVEWDKKISKKGGYPYYTLTGGADKSLARPTSPCILFDGEHISYDGSLVIYSYINSTNISPIMIINRIYENQNLLSL